MNRFTRSDIDCMLQALNYERQNNEISAEFHASHIAQCSVLSLREIRAATARDLGEFTRMHGMVRGFGGYVPYKQSSRLFIYGVFDA